MWDEIGQAVRAGNGLERIQKEFSLEARYPNLASWNIKDDRGRTVHEENIRKIWKHLKGN